MQNYFRFIVLISFVCAFLSCDNNAQSTFSKTQHANDSVTIQAGEKWLKENIENFFNHDDQFAKGFAFLCTKPYTEFKTDAINVDLDGGMTEAELKSKWGRRYSQYAGIGDGFMIAGTDFGKIEVTKCEFKNITEMGYFLYDVLLVDKTYNSKFTRQVVLVKNGDAFLIDDVLEIENKFEQEK